jgi:hypothetical protein
MKESSSLAIGGLRIRMISKIGLKRVVIKHLENL